MPIEIMELVIKAKVGDNDNSNNSVSMTRAENESTKNPKFVALERAVKETLDIVKRKNER